MPKILLVDDDKDFTEAWMNRFYALGYDVEVCHDGGNAYDRICYGKGYDLVIMDFFMPNLRGSTVCSDVRNNDKFKHVPILIVTAFLEKDREFFRQHGASDVLYKPVSKEDLFRKIKELLPPPKS